MKKLVTYVLAASTVVLAGCTVAKVSASDYTTHPSSVEVAFTQAGHHPDKLLESKINHAQSKVDIAIYFISKPNIVKSIIVAKKRGVKVRIITDKTEARNKSEKSKLVLMRNAGIPIKVNTHPGLMHMKVSIVDDKYVVTGSFNYSTGASTKNDENLVVLTDRTLAKDFEIQFDRMWNNTAAFRSW